MEINKVIEEKIEILNSLKDSEYMILAGKVINEMVESLNNGGKILLAGNGGSAADAQHFAGEIVGRFMMEREALPAISLCVDPSVMTCIGNDYGYEKVFSRQIKGLGNKGDIFVAISTSGNSDNLIDAVISAREKGLITVGFLGKDGGKLKEICDYSLVVPSKITPRIQEVHTFTVHIMCENIEKQIFMNSK
ncbi:D-sedoheptulose-7-phosphate isomerase [Anaerocolumna jejuensis]|uniref:D-sedoheptulose-7-phosphate isomerase n=1 Tax=Anaerocolumna jejuensis TaxID=259063 RepID=UPI003F7BF775